MSRESDIQSWQEELISNSMNELINLDRVHQLFRVASFLSRSKGRGRKRRYPAEVNLLSYRGGRFRSAHLFPYDVLAPEVYPYLPADQVEDKLREDIEQFLREVYHD